MSTAAKAPVSCPQCGKQLMVPLTAAGKQGRCPGCTHVFTLPALLEVPESDDLLLAPLAPDPLGHSAPSSGHPLPPVQQTYSQQAFAQQTFGQQTFAQQPYPQQPYAYSQQPPQQQAVNPYMANAYAEAAQKPQNPAKYNHAFGLEQRGLDAGMMGGLLMMVIGGVWFVVGLYFGCSSGMRRSFASSAWSAS